MNLNDTLMTDTSDTNLNLNDSYTSGFGTQLTRNAHVEIQLHVHDMTDIQSDKKLNDN